MFIKLSLTKNLKWRDVKSSLAHLIFLANAWRSGGVDATGGAPICQRQGDGTTQVVLKKRQLSGRSLQTNINYQHVNSKEVIYRHTETLRSLSTNTSLEVILIKRNINLRKFSNLKKHMSTLRSFSTNTCRLLSHTQLNSQVVLNKLL